MGVVENRIPCFNAIFFSGNGDVGFPSNDIGPFKTVILVRFNGSPLFQLRGCDGHPLGDKTPGRQNPNPALRVHDRVLLVFLEYHDARFTVSDERFNGLLELEGNLGKGNDRRGSAARLNALKGHLADPDLPGKGLQREAETVSLNPDPGTNPFQNILPGCAPAGSPVFTWKGHSLFLS